MSYSTHWCWRNRILPVEVRNNIVNTPYGARALRIRDLTLPPLQYIYVGIRLALNATIATVRSKVYRPYTNGGRVHCSAPRISKNNWRFEKFMDSLYATSNHSYTPLSEPLINRYGDGGWDEGSGVTEIRVKTTDKQNRHTGYRVLGNNNRKFIRCVLCACVYNIYIYIYERIHLNRTRFSSMINARVYLCGMPL